MLDIPTDYIVILGFVPVCQEERMYNTRYRPYLGFVPVRQEEPAGFGITLMEEGSEYSKYSTTD